ncbi:hypothetical protein HU200_004519 [Digitaria exilis]|uniref:Uncharacterized protein n=1 Tax=Digitaria exilis TaxID=1010633 RepID=A0A835KXC0_9POAL|nr:hypothetical protein HU200_004519 [Digitaria exilis]
MGATAVTKLGTRICWFGVGHPGSTEAVAFPRLKRWLSWICPTGRSDFVAAEEQQQAV